MSVFFRRGERRNIESPGVPLTSQALVDLFASPTSSGASVSEVTALNFSAVYRAVNTIAGQAAGLPLKTYRDIGGERTETTAEQRVLREPYPDVTPFTFWELVYWDLLLWGNAYLFKVRSELAGPLDVVRLLRLAPCDVTVRRDEATGGNPSGKQFVIGDETFTPADVMHIPGPGYDGLIGLSPIQCAREGIGVAFAAESAAAKLYGSGILAAGVLKTDRELKQETARGIAEAFKAAVGGWQNSGKVAVLDRGITFDQLTIPPGDAQFLESREFQVVEIARWYGVTPALLMDPTATMNWGENARRQFLTFTLNPWLTRVEQVVTAHLLPADVFAEYTRAALMQADVDAQAQAYATAIQFGWMSPAEVRRLDNMPAGPAELEAFLRPVNMADAAAGDEPDIAGKVEAVGALIRAGFDPESALAALGLPPIRHLGLLPVTLQKEEAFDAAADQAAADAQAAQGETVDA